MSISDVEDLKRHLQWALELEHSTIPPYLCALYSLHDGANAAAASVIKGVVMEEMLHMTLVANVLNAVGGKPLVDDPKFIPKYPAYLAHSADTFKVGLLPFCPEAVETFLKIERPALAHARPQADHYQTIAQFYAAIEKALTDLCRSTGEETLFCGHADRQVDPRSWYYGGGGAPVVVTNLKTALAALQEIKVQGEGSDHSIFDGDAELGQTEELAHYFRFEEIKVGCRYTLRDTPGRPTGAELPVDWAAVHPMRPNPKARMYQEQPDIHRLMIDFNKTYTTLLRTLHLAFNGQPDSLFNAVPTMYEMKYRAQALMKIPSGRHDGTTVGPSFEYCA
jgi:hypothetical protein